MRNVECGMWNLHRPTATVFSRGVCPARCRFRIPNSEFRIQVRGFTLVEMLVAVAVVVVMMSLFATIFQMATGAMQKQKGISENDQHVRLVVTMLRNDLRTSQKDAATGALVQCRTFRVLVPWGAGE